MTGVILQKYTSTEQYRFFMGFYTLFHIPLKISHQLTNTSSETCIKLIA
ncbi:hypothetical protein SF301_1227 [Shigella flexneri 2a str. 301]|uniref:Uncharacterized protein n=1 Tax=Shigella flexneri 2a str. 301 TaxID=198214 RepID=A0AB36PH51_SHIFL|nr:hypothetical protein SF2457T_3653 [Shigella flexneri 2a str. 2457T]OXB29058.1 hypothetical protein SF301_1227 [Shigella flexneri 2a str. 301]